jgi:hypothetical protein
MAKKSKRPPARKQQRPQQRPLTQRSSLPLAGLSPSTAPAGADGADDAEDYAATALPVSETDGPMPLPPADEEPLPATAAASRATAAVPASERRRIGRIDPTTAAARPGQRAKSGRQQSTASMFEPLPPEDAAIPFDRVPYVPGDLRRVLVMAGLMVVLVIIADIVISNVVK